MCVGCGKVFFVCRIVCGSGGVVERRGGVGSDRWGYINTAMIESSSSSGKERKDRVGRREVGGRDVMGMA